MRSCAIGELFSYRGSVRERERGRERERESEESMEELSLGFNVLLTS